MIFYLNPNKNPSGAYSAPQTTKADGLLAITEEQKQLVLQYNGFVSVAEGENGETIITPDTQAWEQWKATAPEPEPKPTIQDLQQQITQTQLAMTEVYEMILGG